jgi:Fic family protein
VAQRFLGFANCCVTDWDEDGPRLRANLAAVFEEIERWADKREKISAATIKRWHRQTMRGLDVPAPKFVGRFRGERGLEAEPVYVGAYQGTQASRVVAEVDALIQRLQAVLDALDTLLPLGKELDEDALEAVVKVAAWTHSEWVRIHPFSNGNGRIARTLTNAILLRYGLPPVLRLRPRPPAPYSYAAAKGMEGDPATMEALLMRLLASPP